ncbi:MAG: hypothetical protein J0H82_01345 [Alphaproteobacteria bacterium]|jgi:hypothetical protein|nr:hypothetical protein [Alphaproteobacteria bacterium]
MNAQPRPHPQAPQDVAGHTVLPPTEARQAEKTGRVRYILAISLGLAIAAMIVVYLAF